MDFGALVKHVHHAAATQRVPQDLLQHTAYAGHSTRGHRLDEAGGVVECWCNNGNTVRLVDIAAFEGAVTAEMFVADKEHWSKVQRSACV